MMHIQFDSQLLNLDISFRTMSACVCNPLLSSSKEIVEILLLGMTKIQPVFQEEAGRYILHRFPLIHILSISVLYHKQQGKAICAPFLLYGHCQTPDTKMALISYQAEGTEGND